MISALYRYPKSLRRKMAAEWGRRSQAVQAAARTARGPAADTARWRALHDARGLLVREGATYFGDGRVVPWRVERSRRGRVNQLDVMVGGRLWRTAGARRVAAWCRRPPRREAAAARLSFFAPPRVVAEGGSHPHR